LVDDREHLIASGTDVPVPCVPAYFSIRAARKIARLKGASWLFVENDGCIVGKLDETSLVGALGGEHVGTYTQQMPPRGRPSLRPARALGRTNRAPAGAARG
jgi:hypothetical protein